MQHIQHIKHLACVFSSDVFGMLFATVETNRRQKKSLFLMSVMVKFVIMKHAHTRQLKQTKKGETDR